MHILGIILILIFFEHVNARFEDELLFQLRLRAPAVHGVSSLRLQKLVLEKTLLTTYDVSCS